MRYIRFFSLLLSIIFVVGCAAVGVVETSDPQKNIDNAYALLDANRPLPAEKLILEAIASYQERNDPDGLGRAYMTYGVFLKSPTVSSSYWEKYYRERHGGLFQDKSSTYDNRFIKAKEYNLKALECFQRAEKLYRDTEKFDKLIYVYVNMANCYRILGDRMKTCNCLDRALEAYNETLRRDPSAKPYYVTDGSTFPEFIASIKKEYCL